MIISITRSQVINNAFNFIYALDDGNHFKEDAAVTRNGNVLVTVGKDMRIYKYQSNVYVFS